MIKFTLILLILSCVLHEAQAKRSPEQSLEKLHEAEEGKRSPEKSLEKLKEGHRHRHHHRRHKHKKEEMQVGEKTCMDKQDSDIKAAFVSWTGIDSCKKAQAFVTGNGATCDDPFKPNMAWLLNDASSVSDSTNLNDWCCKSCIKFVCVLDKDAYLSKDGKCKEGEQELLLGAEGCYRTNCVTNPKCKAHDFYFDHTAFECKTAEMQVAEKHHHHEHELGHHHERKGGHQHEHKGEHQHERELGHHHERKGGHQHEHEGEHRHEHEHGHHHKETETQVGELTMVMGPSVNIMPDENSAKKHHHHHHHHEHEGEHHEHEGEHHHEHEGHHHEHKGHHHEHKGHHHEHKGHHHKHEGERHHHGHHHHHKEKIMMVSQPEDSSVVVDFFALVGLVSVLGYGIHFLYTKTNTAAYLKL